MGTDWQSGRQRRKARRVMMVNTPDGQDMEISLLHLKDAHMFASLLASYAQALQRGAPRRPDDFYAEQLLQDRTAQVMGARIEGALVGFMIFYDLPDTLSGLRAAQVDHLHVHHAHQCRGIARAMIEALRAKAEKRGWVKLIFNAPRLPASSRRLYEQMAVQADWTSFVIRIG